MRSKNLLSAVAMSGHRRSQDKGVIGVKTDFLLYDIGQYIARHVFVPPLVALRVKPNQVTAVNALVSGPAIIFFLIRGTHLDYIIVIGILILNVCIDSVDGELARVTGTGSNLGVWFDGMCDYYVQCFVLVGASAGLLLAHPDRLTITTAVLALSSQFVIIRYTDMYRGLLKNRSRLWAALDDGGASFSQRVAAHIMSADRFPMVVLATFRYPFMIFVLFNQMLWFLLYIGVMQYIRAFMFHVTMFRAWHKEGALGKIVHELVLEEGEGTWPQLSKE